MDNKGKRMADGRVQGGNPVSKVVDAETLRGMDPEVFRKAEIATSSGAETEPSHSWMDV